MPSAAESPGGSPPPHLSPAASPDAKIYFILRQQTILKNISLDVDHFGMKRVLKINVPRHQQNN
jgi:hypothetical protein